MIVNNDLNSTSIFNSTNYPFYHNNYNDYDIFQNIFDSTLNLLEEANSLVSYSEQLQIDYITGENDDIISLNMAQSRASFATQFAAQVTDKIITAYKEIMSMSV